MESYSDYYERLKRAGVHPAVSFFDNKVLAEEFRYIEDIHFKDVYPERYLISNYGRLYDTIQQKYMNGRFDKDGYVRVSISDKFGKFKTFRRARLELLVFKYDPNYENLQANHKDGIHNNDIITNLEWTTPKENSDHALLYKLHKMNGVDNPNNKLSEQQVHEICQLISSGKYFDTEIAAMYNVSYATITDIHNSNIWTAISNKYDLSYKKPRKLERESIVEICKLLEKGENLSSIGRQFGITYQTVGAIKRREIHKDISKDFNF